MNALRAAALAPSAPARPADKTPSSRRAARLMTADAATLTEAEQRFVSILATQSSDIANVADLARRFTALVRERRGGDDLKAWLAQAESSPLWAFAKGLRQDLPAVHAAPSPPWSTGPVEGQINRLKMLKRRCMDAPASVCCSAASSPPEHRLHKPLPVKTNLHQKCGRTSFTSAATSGIANNDTGAVRVKPFLRMRSGRLVAHDSRARRLAAYDDVQERYLAGATLLAIARATRFACASVRKYADADTFPERAARAPA